MKDIASISVETSLDVARLTQLTAASNALAIGESALSTRFIWNYTQMIAKGSMAREEMESGRDKILGEYDDIMKKHGTMQNRMGYLEAKDFQESDKVKLPHATASALMALAWDIALRYRLIPID